MAKKAVISGSNGFIGKHVWDTLSEHGIDPIALSQDDIYSPVPQLIELLHYHKPDYIIHLAAYGNHRDQQDQTKIMMANFWTTYNLLKASEMLEYKAFINVASSSCYGIKRGAMSEYDSMYPDTMYAATKVGALQLARAFAMQYKLPITTIVPFSVYGEGESQKRFIPTVVRHLVTKEAMTLNPTSTHDWTHVDDFVEGLLFALNNINELRGELLNVGTGRATSNMDIVGMLEDLAGKKSTYEVIDNPNSFDSPLWLAHNEKLKKLGWKQKVTLKQGLAKCWDYYSKLDG